MSEIKTITSLATETEISFNDFWQFVWVKNTGSGDCYVSNKSGIEAGGVDVIAVKANETAMVITETQSIYSKGATTLECHGQNFAECPFKVKAKGGEQIDVTALSVTTNGVYTAPSGTAYSPVTVDVQEQPWEPLEDGYSNFWFELTNDTLSPWLNFSAKNNDAVIDWGDGSGEVALDTLTPTHTYAKAGRYVVKCKGVTGIDTQSTDAKGNYYGVLQYIELNNEVVSLASQRYSCGLRGIKMSNTITSVATSTFQFDTLLNNLTLSNTFTTLPTYMFYYCVSLENITIPRSVTSLGNQAIYALLSLESITIPPLVTSIGNSCLSACSKLKNIHVQATAPPTLGAGVFTGLPSDYVIYVPVGTLSAYQSAWSAYADHIVEEGGTLTRAQLRAIQNEAKKSDTGDDMR